MLSSRGLGGAIGKGSYRRGVAVDCWRDLNVYSVSARATREAMMTLAFTLAPSVASAMHLSRNGLRACPVTPSSSA